MTPDFRHDSSARTTAPLGSAEYHRQVEEQGQAAMDRALALPLTRLACGIYLVVLVLGGIASLVGVIYEGRWSGIVQRLTFAVLVMPMLAGIARIAITGRSLRPWIADLMQRFEPRSAAPKNLPPSKDH